jgi:hypothetical protein
MSPDRLDLVERDVQAHAKTLSELTMHMSGYDRDKAVQEVKDEYLEERLSRIEKSINAVYRLGWWVLAAFGGSFIALVANFVFKGGLYLGK